MTEVAIVGAGFAGTLQAVHLLRAGDFRVTLIDRGAFGRGVAYATPDRAHLLNVRAANMSAFPDEPDHFVRWLADHAPETSAGFATRQSYGAYLQDILAEAERDHPGRLRRVDEAAVELTPLGERFRLVLEKGERLTADKVVLALGNLPPLDPPGLGPLRLPRDLYVSDPWAQGTAARLSAEDSVVMIGTGLTAVDMVLHLTAAGFAGRMIAISRRGLLPRAHPADAVSLAPPQAPSLPPVHTDALGLLRHVRLRAHALGWVHAVDELRSVTQYLWHEAPAAEQRRFLRHLRPWWDVHRHRLAPEIAGRLGELIRAGRLTIAAGRLRGLERTGDETVEVAWCPAGRDTPERLSARRVINCTGPQGDLARTHEPLLRLLQAGGHIRADALGLGIDVNRRSEALNIRGEANPALFVVGPMSRGAFWEIVAVPDIRVQVKRVAHALAGADLGVRAPTIA